MAASTVLGTIATYAAIASAAASIASIGYAAASTPSSPNLASASRQAARAQANALPYQRGLSAAEQQGTSALRFGYTQSTVSAQERASLEQQLARLEAQAQEVGNAGPSRTDRAGNPIGGQPQDTHRAQRIADLQARIAAVPEGGGTVYLNAKGKPVPASEAVADFTGYGTADVEGQLARKYADIQTELGKKYGTQFAEEARHEAELSDPMGFAARDKELELINKEIEKPTPINPLAKTLDERMLSRAQGPGLDDMSRELLDKAVAESARARGGGGPSASGVESNITTGQEGAARRQANEEQAQAWLASGATPEDVEYRREQQNLSNLGQFVAGRTPQSQFQNLSGAGQGATPFVPGQPMPQQPNNAGTAGPAYSMAAWQAGLKQPNSWLAGISSALGGLTTIAQATPRTGG